MKKLCELVDLTVNNDNCLVYKVKDDKRMDLISLGCFLGNEDMIRMTKGRTPEITVFYKDGSTFSYHFGEGSTSGISENQKQQRTMIRECSILDFGIVCDYSHMPLGVDYALLVKETSSITSMDDATRKITLNSGGGLSCNIRVNEQTLALHVPVNEVENWFLERGYAVAFNKDISKGLECGNTYGICHPLNVNRKISLDQKMKEVSSNKENVNVTLQPNEKIHNETSNDKQIPLK